MAEIIRTGSIYFITQCINFMEKSTPTATSMPLQEGLDYYIENGYWVFTRHYLLQRGWCCGNGCRHCPYDCKKGATVPTHEDTHHTDRLYR